MVGRDRPQPEFYDYEDKYLDGAAELVVPADLPRRGGRGGPAAGRAAAVRALRAEGMARVDFFYEERGGGLLVNEVNTIPGFTPFSMYPRLWAASGLPYAELVDQLVRSPSSATPGGTSGWAGPADAPPGGQGHGRLDQQGRAQERQQLVAPAHAASGPSARSRRPGAPRPRSPRRSPRSTATAAGAGRPGGACCRRPSPPRGTRCPVDQRVEGLGEPAWRRRAEPADLAHAARAARAGGRRAGTRPARAPRPGPQPGPARARARSSVAGELGRRPVDHRVEQRAPSREVVEDRLLAHAEPGRQVVERGGLVAPGAERRERRVEDPLRVRGATALTKW